MDGRYRVTDESKTNLPVRTNLGLVAVIILIRNKNKANIHSRYYRYLKEKKYARYKLLESH